MTMFANGESVIWHRWRDSAGKDEYGEPLPGGYSPVDLGGVGFAPESTEEDSPDRRVTSSAKLYVSGSSIPYCPKDQFTVRGERYAVDGRSQGGWVNPFTGVNHGQEIKLVRVTGGDRG